ncbi:hypothetical protein [Wohlfahrtiimonas larvae]|uniref:Type 1 fimbrial protein n=1 Tax=Wohlfahrtiimonas larvae TaxID=1157986 RepID=A0ABP9MS14_9GAMM|nr:hypothetical protein [Wohlfahrtiimonas larvae]
MKKLSLSLISMILLSAYGHAEETKVTGKIRFVGSVTAPSCQVVTPTRSSNLTFTNCKIQEARTSENIQKMNITTQRYNKSDKQVMFVAIMYK